MRQAAFDTLQRSAVREGHEHRVVASDGARDLRPAGPVQRRGDGVRGAGQRPQHQQQARLVELDRQIVEQFAEAVLAAGLSLDEPGRQGVGQGAS